MKKIIVACLMMVSSPVLAGNLDWSYKGKKEIKGFRHFSAEVPVGASRLALMHGFPKTSKRRGKWVLQFLYKGKTKIEKFRHFTVRFNKNTGSKAIEKRIPIDKIAKRQFPNGFFVSAQIPYHAVELLKAGYILDVRYRGGKNGKTGQNFNFKFPLNNPSHIGSYAVISKLENELKNYGAVSCCKATGIPMPTKSKAEIAKLKSDRLKAKFDRKRRLRKEKQARIWKRIRRFEFPDSDCTWPGVSSTRARRSAVERSNRRRKAYRRCLKRADNRDQEAVYRLVKNVDGKIEHRGNGRVRYKNLPKGFGAPLKDIIAHKKRRTERRVERWRTLQKAVKRRNAAVSREEFWDGVQASTDRVARNMERQRRRQMLQQPPMYVSPGYR